MHSLCSTALPLCNAVPQCDLPVYTPSSLTRHGPGPSAVGADYKPGVDCLPVVHLQGCETANVACKNGCRCTTGLGYSRRMLTARCSIRKPVISLRSLCTFRGEKQMPVYCQVLLTND